MDDPRPRTAVLLAVAVWSFARAYYFAFYVIEHYIDPSYRFAGLVSLLRYLARSTIRAAVRGQRPERFLERFRLPVTVRAPPTPP